MRGVFASGGSGGSGSSDRRLIPATDGSIRSRHSRGLLLRGRVCPVPAGCFSPLRKRRFVSASKPPAEGPLRFPLGDSLLRPRGDGGTARAPRTRNLPLPFVPSGRNSLRRAAPEPSNSRLSSRFLPSRPSGQPRCPLRQSRRWRIRRPLSPTPPSVRFRLVGPFRPRRFLRSPSPRSRSDRPFRSSRSLRRRRQPLFVASGCRQAGKKFPSLPAGGTSACFGRGFVFAWIASP